MINKKDLHRWQKQRDSCEHSKDSKLGLWCTKDNIKCCFDNCKTDPLTSDGNIEIKKEVCLPPLNDLTKKQLKAYTLRLQGLSYRNIGELMGITKKRAWELCQRVYKLGGKRFSKKDKKKGVNDKLGGVTKKPKGVNTNKISLHNDSIAIEAKIDFKLAKGEVKQLKYTQYKLNKTEDHIIKVFSHKVVIQFRKDIITDTIEEAYTKATKRISAFINTEVLRGITLKKDIKQLSRHYAILGTTIAKKYIREGKRLFIYDRWDNKERVRIDYSDKDKKGGLPHFEFTHTDKSKEDADKNKAFIEDIINYPHDLPSITKSKLDFIVNVQKEYAEQIRLHLKVQQETLKTLRQIQRKL